MELQVAAAPLVAVALQVAAGLQVAAAQVAVGLQDVVAQVAGELQVAAPRRLPTGAVISVPRMARAPKVVALHKAHAQLKAPAVNEALADSEVLALDVPATRSLQPILSRVVAQ